jgi:hypothetical protein
MIANTKLSPSGQSMGQPPDPADSPPAPAFENRPRLAPEPPANAPAGSRPATPAEAPTGQTRGNGRLPGKEPGRERPAREAFGEAIADATRLARPRGRRR